MIIMVLILLLGVANGGDGCDFGRGVAGHHGGGG